MRKRRLVRKLKNLLETDSPNPEVVNELRSKIAFYTGNSDEEMFLPSQQINETG